MSGSVYVNSSSSVTMVKWGIGSVENFSTPVVATVSCEALSRQLNVVVSSLNGTKISLSDETLEILSCWVLQGHGTIS